MKLVAASAATAVFPAASQARDGQGLRLLKPRRLKEGALVGLVAPGGVVDDAIIQKCVANLEGAGFRVKPGRNLRAAHGGYAGSVRQRLDDLHDMFSDREVAAVWPARGGSGAMALLPQLDYALIRRNPKVLIGFSDVTALHLALLRHAGLVTFHGPVAWSAFSDFSVAQLRAVVMEPAAKRELPLADENDYRVLREGVAEGRLAGGNLSLLCALTGTPYAVQGRALLFIEEVGEAPYRIDRMLTQLRLAKILTEASAVAMGVFRRCDPPDNDPSLTLAQTIDENMALLRVPSAYGLSFGHIAKQITLPIGTRARLDTRSRTLTLLEPAVL